MRSAILTCRFPFEAMHSLPNHHGTCRRPHGHSYCLEVSVRGPIIEAPGTSSDGMVMDLEDLKKIVNGCLLTTLADTIPRGPDADRGGQGGMDHNDLNAITGIRTTAENLVHWIWDALVSSGMKEDVLYRVRLWETARGYAEITHAERHGGQEA